MTIELCGLPTWLKVILFILTFLCSHGTHHVIVTRNKKKDSTKEDQMGKVTKSFEVDSEVAAIGDALLALAKDIKAKASLAQDFADVSARLMPELSNIANIGADVKSNPDDRAFLAAALEQVVDAFLA
jgi:hypothetical protein